MTGCALLPPPGLLPFALQWERNPVGRPFGQQVRGLTCSWLPQHSLVPAYPGMGPGISDPEGRLCLLWYLWHRCVAGITLLSHLGPRCVAGPALLGNSCTVCGSGKSQGTAWQAVHFVGLSCQQGHEHGRRHSRQRQAGAAGLLNALCILLKAVGVTP